MKRVNRPAAEATDFAELERRVGFQLRLASTAFMADLAETLAGVPLRPAEYSLLSLVASKPGVTQTELCSRLAIKKTNIVPLVARLEKRGLLARAPDPADRRAQKLLLTPKARAAIAKWHRLVTAHEERMLRALDDTERTRLWALLIKMRAAPPTRHLSTQDA